MTATIATAPSTIATRIGFLIEFPPLSRPKKQGTLGHAPQVSSKRPRDAERRYKSRFVRGTVTYKRIWDGFDPRDSQEESATWPDAPRRRPTRVPRQTIERA